MKGRTIKTILVTVAQAIAASALGQAPGHFDNDNDNVTDVIIESPPEPGSGSFGIVNVVAGTDATPLFNLTSVVLDDLFGLSASAIGDLDGDGHSEIAVPAPGHAFDSDRPGRIYIYDGLTHQLALTLQGELHEMLTWRVDATADLDGDGHLEILVHTIRSYPGEILVDCWRIYSGATGQSLTSGFYPERWWPWLSLQGHSDSNPLPTADVNGDGLVNAADLFAIVAQFGEPVEPASPPDVVVNGFVDYSDFLEVSENLGFAIDPYPDLIRSLSAVGHVPPTGTSFATSAGALG